jgi:exopolysaccharide biosynthesis polyprenyl glycosylphosphotransferase
MTSLTSLFEAGTHRRRPTRTHAPSRLDRLDAGWGRPRSGLGTGTATAHSWRTIFPRYRALAVAREGAVSALAGSLTFAAGHPAPQATAWTVAVAVLVPLALAAAGAYRWRTLGEGQIERHSLLRGGLWLGAALVVIGYLGIVAVPPTLVVLALPLALVGAATGRALARRGVVTRRLDGEGLVRTLVLGAPEPAREVIELARRVRSAGYEVVGVCTDDSDDVDVSGAPVLGGTGAVRAVVTEHEIDVVMLVGSRSQTTAREVGWELDGTRASLVLVPSVAEVASSRVRVRPVGDLWSLQLDVALRRRRALGKEVFDRLVGGLLLVLGGIVILPAMLAVKVTSPGPALYRSIRVGLDGTPFVMWKIRSMYADADARRAELLDRDEGNGLLFKMRSDPRITPVGRVLRRLSIDELPQLLNVVKGEMSIVGPRPALAEETACYVGDEMRRLVVKPGLTGLWQVSGRSDLSREESIRLDLRYVDNRSPGLDVAILGRTAGAVLGGRGAY